MRRGGLVTAVLAGLLSAVPALPSSARFIDDDGIPAERAIERLAERGVVHGCDPPADTSFCPERSLNRAEAAKVVVILARQEGTLRPASPGGSDHFTDDDDMWGGSAEPYIDALAAASVVHGCDPPANTRFCPGHGLTRGQIAKVVVAALGLTAPAGYATPWSGTAGHFWHEAARVGAYHGLWDSSAGRFDGDQPVTRAELAQVAVAAVGDDACSHDPFTAARAVELASRHPGVSFTAYAYDLRNGCAYWMSPAHRQPVASVFKVMVMAGTLLEAQAEGRPVSDWEMSRLDLMITESANPPVRALWDHFGSAPWFGDQAAIFGLDQTQVVGDDGQPWGRTATSAKDQADLLRQVLISGPLEEAYQEVAWEMMTSVVASQRWGANAGVPAGHQIAQKNGFVGDVANSVGVVSSPTGPVYVVSILTEGWPHWQDGVAIVDEIGRWVAEALLP